MLELAIAEAYRPRRQLRLAASAPPRPAAFATNPNARCSTPSLRSHTPSTPSQSSTVTSRSLSFRSIIPRRKRPDSVLSDRTVKPDDPTAYQSNSTLGCASVTSTSPTTAEPSKIEPAAHIASSRKVTEKTLPFLPPQVPLPPQDELSHFDEALQLAISSLRPSYSLHQDLAIMVLQHMAHLSDLASCIATSWPEFWALLVHAAELIASVLPTGDIGTCNVLVGSLAQVAEHWNEKENRSTVEIAAVVGSVFDELLQKRRAIDQRLGEEVARWLCGYCRSRQRRHGNMVRMLTLDVSVAVLAALEYALASDTDLEIQLSVLSSLEHGLPPPPMYSRLNITTYSSSAVGTASQSVDVLLLEFSCVGSDGDIQCRTGALGTAACVRALSPAANIIGFGNKDNIASAVLERRTAGEEVGGIEGTQESIPGKFVDVYVTDIGPMKGDDLERFAMEAEGLGRYILREKRD